ncbi:argonaute/piwi family protein [Acinetobacter guillouiae]|uniref:argonaute/piwi family protein n=1 Tax=Acinetobacter guillouiae TaxID=106649 RepID=UPI003AF66205
MKLKILDEPSLEFGNGIHICPKAGIENQGVYDKKDELRRNELRIGMVGRGEGLDMLDVWLDFCTHAIPGKGETPYPNLFRGFGGINQIYGFYTRLIRSPQFSRTLQRTEIMKIIKLPTRNERVKSCVELYYDQIRFLSENRSIDVIICAISDDLYKALTKDTLSTEPTNENEESAQDEEIEFNFRRLLKAKCMHLGIPLQLVQENSLDKDKLAGRQDVATRAWNFCTALYYKGNRTVPWRLVEDKYKPKTCYIGVGFYYSRDGKTVSSSLAQVFDEFGHGVILRGSPVSLDKDDRRPFMSEEQAYELLLNALTEYDRALYQMPARIVIHKSSKFRESEIKGFSKAIQEKGIRSKDFVSITNTNIRLFGEGLYPPHRGTLMSLNDNTAVLYTKGFVDFYKTYPGMYIPSPVLVSAYENDSSLEELCKEVLGLTKMNWNNTQLDGRLPITLECAQKVGDIIKYIPHNEKPQVNYSFYM